MQELGKLLLDGADQLTATAYTTGSGSGQPTGIITSLVGSAGTVPLIAPAVAETLGSADVYAVQNALPPRFQPNVKRERERDVTHLFAGQWAPAQR
jgi:HK97 family phage major capsid protein